LFSFHGPPKFTQIVILGLKTYQLATLVGMRTRKLGIVLTAILGRPLDDGEKKSRQAITRRRVLRQWHTGE
jgi:hypothetical protein